MSAYCGLLDGWPNAPNKCKMFDFFPNFVLIRTKMRMSIYSYTFYFDTFKNDTFKSFIFRYFDIFGGNFDFDTFKNNTFERVIVDRLPHRPCFC